MTELILAQSSVDYTFIPQFSVLLHLTLILDDFEELL